MKNLYIGIALALICLCPLFIQAQANSGTSIANLTFDGTNPDSNTMVVSWDTIANTDSVKLQVKGGGITDSWMSVEGLFTTAGEERTSANFQDLSTYQVSGTTYRFRVKVTLQDGSSTPWAYVDQS